MAVVDVQCALRLQYTYGLSIDPIGNCNGREVAWDSIAIGHPLVLANFVAVLSSGVKPGCIPSFKTTPQLQSFGSFSQVIP